MTHIAQAINQALDHCMSHDKNVVLMGQDIGINGGVFRVTEGLQEKYGSKRVIDSPISESLLAGMAVGMSTHGLKPVIEFQFMGFLYSALDQIINHLARMRNRTRGNLHCPAVLRMPYGGGVRAPEHHSESTEALLAHIPGLTVVIPSSPSQAYHLMIDAIQSPDPVIFLEPKRIYRSYTEVFEPKLNQRYLNRSQIISKGNDLTIVAWGAMLRDTVVANQRLKTLGISAEIIDQVCLNPLDLSTVINSVKKTNRCLIVHEANENYGAAAEIGFQIFQQCFDILEAPVERLCASQATMPYFKLEHLHLPQIDDIIKSCEHLMRQ